MTFRDLKRLFPSETNTTTTTVLTSEQQQKQNDLAQELHEKPFWIWRIPDHKQEHRRTRGNCCFNHITGLPQKDGIAKPLFDYQKILYDILFKEIRSFQDKHLWVRKATGIGATEFFLRLMAWLKMIICVVIRWLL